MAEKEVIRVHLGDWMMNAGIVGFVRVMGEENITICRDYIEFDEKILTDFSERYFQYFIKTYEETLSWHRIVSFQEQIEKWQEDDFEHFSEKDLERLNSYIKDVLKKYLNSNSYKAAYALIGEPLDIEMAVKNVKPVGKITKKNTFEMQKTAIIEEVKATLPQIEQLIDYCQSEQGKKYLAAKNVIYTVIRHGWDGVSILNPQTKIKDMYEDIQTYFVNPIEDYLEADQKKFKFECCLCYRPIKNLDEVLSFLNEVGYDTKRKASHGWGFQNDLAICPICKMILACLPAGFSYVYGQGVFVNANASVEDLIQVNQQMQLNIYKFNREMIRSSNTYRSLVRSLAHEDRNAHVMELDDIQVIRYENETYRFNILSKQTLKTLEGADKNLEKIAGANFREGKDPVSLYQIVVEKIFNNENLFLLLNQLLRDKAGNVEGMHCNEHQLIAVIRINQEIIGGLGAMEKLSQEEISKIRQIGWHFKKGYDNPEKPKGIVYKLLNALKMNDRNQFMDVILNCYAYLNRQVPSVFNQIFINDETFKTIGYAFLTGVIGKEISSEDNGGKA